MPGDFSRKTFDPHKHYVGVLMQQGRVQLDADWNEQQSIGQHRDQTEAKDVIGCCGAPLVGGGFALSGIDGGRDLRISTGHIYVDGILCELDPTPVPASVVTSSPAQVRLHSRYMDGYPLKPGDWVELFDNEPTSTSPPGTVQLLRVGAVDEDTQGALIALEPDLSVFPSSPPSDLQLRRVPTFLTQPDYPNPSVDNAAASPPLSVSSPPSDLALPPGLYLAYLDVWHRDVTSLDDPRIRELALGGPDTAARLKTTCQVHLFEVAASPPLAVDCAAEFPEWNEWITHSSGRMNARTRSPAPDEDPCQLPPTAGYRRLENQLYRVEIHQGGNRGQATFKWSRDNGSVETRIIDIDPTDGTRVQVSSTGKDEMLGFQPGQWVEIIDDEAELKSNPHPLVQIDEVAPGQNLIILKTDISSHRGTGRKLRRWDQSQSLTSQGVILLTSSDAEGWINLEDGVQIQFSDGTYRSGDYWLIPARTNIGEIEWPPFETPNAHPIPQRPFGIHHHYCRLAVIAVASNGSLTVHDCRCRFPSLTQSQDLYYVSGDGQEAMPVLPSTPGALAALAQPLVVGVVNPQCREYPARVRFTVTQGTGRLKPAGAAGSGTQIIELPADEHGLIACQWDLGADLTTAAARNQNLPSQQVEARLLDEHGSPIHLPIRFNANLSVAEQVAYDPGDCAGLAGQTNVQTAIDRLADQISLYKVSGDAQVLLPNQPTLQPVRVRAANRCGPVPLQSGWVGFTVLLGGGSVSAVTIDASGIASCIWTLGPGFGTQELQAALQPLAGPAAEPTRVVFTASRSAAITDPGMRVTDLRLNIGPPLINDTDVPVQQLVEGIRIICDRVVDPNSVTNKPTCFLTLEMPYPFNQSDTALWGPPVIGFQPLVVAAELSAVTNSIVWRPTSEARQWLLQQLFQMMAQLRRGNRVLARLKLQGNFIWAQDNPDLFLDGDVFGVVRLPATHTDLRFPSGNDLRGGNLEMWFWLRPSQTSGPPTFIVHPGPVSVATGTPVTFRVEAVGTGPLSLQWFRNGNVIPGATAPALALPPVTLADNGSVFFAQVTNAFGSARSNPATLTVSGGTLGGGTITIGNRGANFSAPVLRADGQTRVGSGFNAQLLISTDPANLRPVGTPRPFLTGTNAGFWRTETVPVPEVPPGGTVLGQVQVWPNTFPSFEAAATANASVGISEIFPITAGDAQTPNLLEGMRSFRLSS